MEFVDIFCLGNEIVLIGVVLEVMFSNERRIFFFFLMKDLLV